MFEIEKKSKTKSISVRFKEDEYKFIQQQAKKHKLSVTDYFKWLLGNEYNRVMNENANATTNTNTEVNADNNTTTIKNDNTNGNTPKSENMKHNATNNKNGNTNGNTKKKDKR